jgi:tetratricopeptide (TPR) repeat protein
MRYALRWSVLATIACAALSADAGSLWAQSQEGPAKEGPVKEAPAKQATVTEKAGAKDPAAELAAKIAKLISQLGDDDYAVRQRAQEQLTEIGGDAFDALAEAQNNEDPEVASRSRYLLRSIRVEFTKEGDPAVVRQQFKDYHSLNAVQRLERINALAVLTDPAALAALCRVARYEQGEANAKHAAIAVISQKLPPGADEKLRGQQILDTLGISQRPASRWLRAYAEASRGGAERVDPQWSKFAEEEAAVLRRAPERSHADIISGLLKYRVELLTRLQRPKDIEPVLKQLVEAQPDDETTLAQFIEWVQGKKAWTALDALQKRFAERIDKDPVLLYALASAREVQGQSKVADETAAKALALNAEDLEAHYRTAFLLRDRGMTRWAEKEFRQIIGSMPANNVYAMHSRYALAEWLHDLERDADAGRLLEETLAAMQRNIKEGSAENNGRRDIGSVKSRMHYFSAMPLRETDAAKHLEHLEKGIEADPTDADVLIALYRLPKADEARRKKTLKQIQDAVDLFRQQIAKEPGEANAYNQLAWLVGNTEGNYQEALECSLKSLELKPDTSAYLDTLGRCYYAVKDYQNALKHQRMAVERDPHSQQMRRQLAIFEKAVEGQGQKK